MWGCRFIIPSWGDTKRWIPGIHCGQSTYNDQVEKFSALQWEKQESFLRVESHASEKSAFCKETNSFKGKDKHQGDLCSSERNWGSAPRGQHTEADISTVPEGAGYILSSYKNLTVLYTWWDFKVAVKAEQEQKWGICWFLSKPKTDWLSGQAGCLLTTDGWIR